MLLKYGWKNIKKNLFMNFLVILQLSVAFLLLISMISSITSRFQLYNPFEEEFNSNGRFYCIANAINPNTNMTISSKEEIGDMIECEKKVFGIYTPWFSYGDNNINCISYDKEFINKYTPKLEHGKWFNECEGDKEILQVVVSQNQCGLKVGDVIILQCIDYPVKARVIGVLENDATIINFSGTESKNNDCRILYRNYDFEREESPLFIFNQEELVDKDVIVQLNGQLFIIYSDDVSKEIMQKNDRIIKRMMVLSSVPLDQMKMDSLRYIFSQIYDLFPIFICVIILTFIGSISTSALSTKRQLKNYAIYYMCGLKWKLCATVNACSSAICAAISFVISIVLTIIIKLIGVFGETVITIGLWQILGCSILVIVYIVLSMIFPLRIIGKNSPTGVLKTN